MRWQTYLFIFIGMLGGLAMNNYPPIIQSTIGMLMGLFTGYVIGEMVI